MTHSKDNPIETLTGFFGVVFFVLFFVYYLDAIANLDKRAGDIIHSNIKNLKLSQNSIF